MHIEQIRADRAGLEEYARIPMLVWVDQVLRPEMPQNGLGGIRFVQEAVARPYWKDLGAYDNPLQLPGRFDLSNWALFLAWDGGRAVGGAMVAARTPNEHMLEEREDLAVLWDLRVDSAYWGRGIGSMLFAEAANWSRQQGLLEMKIESQNNNVRAAHFYAKKGAVLGAINTRAYRGEPDIGEEIQLIWYLDLAALPQAGK